MILAIDIGNTTTSFGVFERGKLASQFSIATQSSRTPDEIALQFKALATTRRLHLRRAKQIILCSVVPKMSSVLVQALQSLSYESQPKGGRSPKHGREIPIRIVGQDIEVPLVNRYAYPEQVGQDRLVGAYAAWSRFKRNCIVADFGTAITIDVVTRKGEYLGGIIAPGLEIALEALASKTALLPKVELRKPPELLGRDTANSIRSGVLYGFAAMCDGLIAQLKGRYAPQAAVVATGGASPLMSKAMKTITHLEPHLVLQGLAKLAKLAR